jgi:hypothetical protein
MDVQIFFCGREIVDALPLNESLCDDMTRGWVRGEERRERRMLVIVPCVGFFKILSGKRRYKVNR